MALLKADGPRKAGGKAGGRGSPGRIEPWREMLDSAVEAGRMAPEALPAAMSLAGQVIRLESRYEQYYQLGEEDGEVKKAQSSPEALDKMGKCEKQLAELKARLLELAGLDRQHAARTRLLELQAQAAEQGGEVVLKLEGFGEGTELQQ